MVSTTKPTISINRQDTYTRTLQIKDTNGDLITGDYSWAFTVRESIPETSETDDTQAKISKTGTFTDGKSTLNVTSTDTDIDPKTYVFDFQITKPDGSIHSTRTGNFVVLGDTTRSA